VTKFLLFVLFAIAVYYGYRRRTAVKPKIAAPESLRQTRYGEVIGFKDRNGLLCWQGIPFAAPPINELRWKAPRPPAPWQGVREALAPGNKPAQVGSATGGFKKAEHGKPAGSEDCLYLNIWAPEKSAKKRPVMVWIYGGGNAAGAADIPAYNIPYFAAGGDVVVVTFNYRLGLLGWFYHSALAASADNPEDASGNYGTLDCVQALRWVNENIAAFGGDPDNITVFGESAGGINTLSMLLVPQAKGLFHKAIAQSAITTCYNLDEAQNYSDDLIAGHEHSSKEVINLLLQQQGLAVDSGAARRLQDSMDELAIRQFLCGLSAKELLSPFNKVVMGMYQSPRPIADGAVFPSCSWHEAFSDPALHNSVPLMIGANRDEFKLFLAGDTDDYVDMRFGVLPTPKDPERYQRDARYLSDLWRASAVDEIAQRLVVHNTAATYAYRFDWDDWPRLPLMNLPELVGASHGVEIMFMFGLVAERPWLRFLLGSKRFQEMTDLSEAMRQYWTTFASTGTPNTANNTALAQWTPWPSAAQNSSTLLRLDAPIATDTQMISDRLSIADIRQNLLRDPLISGNPDELRRMYARLFIYGIQGRYWDSLPYPGLEQYQVGGAERELAKACRPALVP
jgi:para-nitrobenzyl esterase